VREKFFAEKMTQNEMTLMDEVENGEHILLRVSANASVDEGSGVTSTVRSIPTGVGVVQGKFVHDRLATLLDCDDSLDCRP